MGDKKKQIIIGICVSVIAVVFIVFGTLACLGVFREFNAQGYVDAMLDQTLKGEVEAAVEMTDGSTEEALCAQYESGIKSFVKNSLLGGAELDSELETQYVDLCKKIFKEMKYSVEEAEKVSDGEFQVPVKYQPSNVLQLFITSAKNEVALIEEKKEKGEYRGTFEEIETQMKTDYLTSWYTCLDEAYSNMQFGEEQTMVFTVKKGESDLYELENSSITEFLTKILGVDEIQD